jgi:hypothetical protein
MDCGSDVSEILTVPVFPVPSPKSRKKLIIEPPLKPEIIYWFVEILKLRKLTHRQITG